MNVAALPPFFRLIALASVDSTNRELRELALAGAPEGTAVTALEQTAGRGRRGRDWQSPPGNLYLSVLLRPTGSPAQAGQAGFVAAVALAEAVEKLVPERAAVTLKWPNDLLVNGRKAAGLLLEASGKGAGLDWLVLGLGVNVTSFPADTAFPATCLEAEGVSVGVNDLLAAFAWRLDAWLGRWRTEGFAPVRQAWLERAHGLGQPITVRLERETLEGRFEALDESGALMLHLPDDARRNISAGDVFYPGL